MTTITICGGGALGHVIAAYIAAKRQAVVNLLTNHPDRWFKTIDLTLPDNTVLTAKPNLITSDASAVIPQADIVLICLPGMYIREELIRIKPYLNATTHVGTVVSSTGFFFHAHELLPTQPLFGFQRVPFIAKVIQYGHKAHLRGFRERLFMAVENSTQEEQLQTLLATLLSTPITLRRSYLEVSLTNSNALLHTSRLYTLWKDYHIGIFYPTQSRLYEDFTVDAAQLYIDMDNELQHLLRRLGIAPDVVPSVLDYYESHDAQSLCHKIQSIPSFKSLLTPMTSTPQGYIPDFSSRLFTEDFPYSLYYIYALLHRHNLAAPHIDQVYHWGNAQLTQQPNK